MEQTITTHKERGIIVLRWVLLVPGAALAAIVANIVGIFSWEITTSGWLLWLLSSETSQNLGTLLGSWAFGYILIYAAYKIAPSHKRPATFVVFALFLVLSGAGTLIQFEHEGWWAVGRLVGSLISAGLATYLSVSSEEDPFTD